MIEIDAALLPILASIIASIVSVVGAYAVSGWRLKDLERRLIERENAHDDVKEGFYKLKLHVAEKYATLDTIRHLENKIDKMRDDLVEAITKRGA